MTTGGNDPRFRVGTDHVESWFVRANDPHQPRAVWLKATMLTRRDGTSLVQAWCSVFDGDRTRAYCTEVSLAETLVNAAGGFAVVDLGVLRLELDPDTVTSVGKLGDRVSTVEWDLSLSRTPGPLGRPLLLLPSDRLIDGPVPRNKLLTPLPIGSCSGSLSWDGVSWDLDGWHGMQGHNWGAAHSPEYAWGHCVFTADDEPVAVVEGASGRIELGRRSSPLISMLVVRYGERELRFDKLLDLWRQRPTIDFPTWTLAMRGRQGRAELTMTGTPNRMVCLAYQNPARATSYCLNSKTAEVRLHLEPKGGAAVTLHSTHGGALEFLTPRPEPRVQPIA